MAASARRDLFLSVNGNVDNLSAAMKAGRTSLMTIGTAANEVQAEVAAAFAKLGGGSTEQSLRSIEKSYRDTFNNIRANAKAAMAAPTPQAAVSVINSQAAQQTALDAENQAAALRMAADAAARVAERAGEAGAANRVLATSLEAVAIGAAQEAAALRTQADVLAGVDAELRATSMVSGQLGDSVVHAHSRMGASGMILQHVMRSTTDSFAAGLPPVMIFSEQIGRLGEAAALSGDSLGKFGAFLTGGWGMALTAAVSVGATLARVLLEGGDAAKTDAVAHNALKDAVDRLDNSQAILNNTTRRGIQDDLDAAEATRRREVQVRKLIDAELEAAKAKLSSAKVTMANPGGTIPGSMFSAGGMQAADAQRNIDMLTTTQQLNQKRTDEANTAIRVGRGKLIDRRIEEQTDPNTRIRNRYDDEHDRLQRLHDRGRISDEAYDAAVLKATRERDAATEAEQSRGRRAPRAKVDHTVEKAAESDRAYQSALADAQNRYAKAQLALADTAEKRFEIDITELRYAQQQKILERRDQVTAKKLTQPQANELNRRDAATEQLAETAAYRKMMQANLDTALATDRREIDGKIAMLRLQDDLAKTQEQRRRIGLQLLAQEEKLLIAEATRDLASNDPQRQQRGADALVAIGAQHDAKTEQIRERTMGPGESFQDNLKKNIDDMSGAIQGVGVNALGNLESGLMGVLDGTKSVAAGFTDMAKSIISDLERIAVERLIIAPIADALFGKADGSSTGFLTSILSKIGKHADGGHITGPGSGRSDSILSFLSNGEFVVNAAATSRNLPLLHAINDNTLPGFADGGLVDPAQIYLRAPPSAASVARAGGGRPLMFDLRGAVMTQELLRQMESISSQHAQAAAIGGSQMAQQDMADRQSQAIPI